MSVTLDIDVKALKERFSKDVKLAQAWLDEEVIADSDPYVPMDTGMLASSALEHSAIGE